MRVIFSPPRADDVAACRRYFFAIDYCRYATQAIAAMLLLRCCHAESYTGGTYHHTTRPVMFSCRYAIDALFSRDATPRCLR